MLDSSDTLLIQEGISEKVGLTLQYVVTFVAGFVIAFIKNWELTLVLCAAFPLIAVSGAIMGKMMSSQAKAGQEIYAKAGGVAEEVLSCIRTVVAFGGEERGIKKYEGLLDDALRGTCLI